MFYLAMIQYSYMKWLCRYRGWSSLLAIVKIGVYDILMALVLPQLDLVPSTLVFGLIFMPVLLLVGFMMINLWQVWQAVRKQATSYWRLSLQLCYLAIGITLAFLSYFWLGLLLFGFA